MPLALLGSVRRLNVRDSSGLLAGVKTNTGKLVSHQKNSHFFYFYS